MTDLAFRGEIVAGLIAIVRAWAKGLTGVDLAREVRCGMLMVVRAIEKRYPELVPPREYRPDPRVCTGEPPSFVAVPMPMQTLDSARET